MGQASRHTVALVVIVVAMILVLSAVANGLLLLNDRVGEPVGGCLRAKAVALVDELGRRLTNSRLTLVAGEETCTIDPADFQVRLDAAATVNALMSLGRSGDLRWDLEQVWESMFEGRRVDLVVTWDQEALQDFLSSQVGPHVWEAPENAYIDDSGQIVPEKLGRMLDIEQTAQRIVRAWQRLERRVEAVVVPVRPHTTAEKVRHIRTRHLLARFSTYFDLAETSRNRNIALAAQLIDNTLLLPGEEFSFNEIVGPRFLERGFQQALEIVDHEFVLGIGGGVCQVTSTLYNAAVLADLEVVERRNHSRPLNYIVVGRDATVYYGLVDLRFRNSHPFAVRIDATIEQNRLTVSVYGQRPLPYEVDIERGEVELIPPEVEVVEDPGIKPGEVLVERPGRQGCRVKVWKVIYINGSEVYREILSEDYYPPETRVLQVAPVTKEPASVQANGSAAVDESSTAPDSVQSAPDRKP